VLYIFVTIIITDLITFPSLYMLENLHLYPKGMS